MEQTRGSTYRNHMRPGSADEWAANHKVLGFQTRTGRWGDRAGKVGVLTRRDLAPSGNGS